MIGSLAVIDANVALKLLFPDPMQSQCRALFTFLNSRQFDIVAPTLWAYETVSGVCKAIHFGLLTRDEGQQILSKLADLNVRLILPSREQQTRAFEWTLHLNRAAAYDSFYLALAESLGCELWTADSRLCQVASVPWVRYIDHLD